MPSPPNKNPPPKYILFLLQPCKPIPVIVGGNIPKNVHKCQQKIGLILFSECGVTEISLGSLITKNPFTIFYLSLARRRSLFRQLAIDDLQI
jgi:hypothetical protein